MPTMDEHLARPIDDRLKRLRTTTDEIRTAIEGKNDTLLARRPEPRSWSPKEIVCHLRDVEELFLVRFQTMLAMDEPAILTFSATPEALAAWGIGGDVGHPLDPDRWAEERQYLRCDTAAALRAFARRRDELLALLDGLTEPQWQRAGIHPRRGRMPLGDWVASLAGHDDNHLDQLRRALDGRP
jgi:DinB family protein